MSSRKALLIVVGLGLSGGGLHAGVEPFLEKLPSTEVRRLYEEVLERNPRLAAGVARATAAFEGRRASGLPDPRVAATAFVAPPETRVGPQEWSLSVSQEIPWLGKLRLERDAAEHHAIALDIESDALRLGLVTDLTVDLVEIVYLDRLAAIHQLNRQHLLQHEEIARARYSTGAGAGQDVLKLQAEISAIDLRLLDVERRRHDRVARVNEMRDENATAPLPRLPETEAVPITLDVNDLLARAIERRPDLRAAEHHVQGAVLDSRLAASRKKPDFTVGFSFTQVAARNDEAGRLAPPAGNGNDVFGLTAGVKLPVWRDRLEAELLQAEELERSATEHRRALVARSRREIGDLVHQIQSRWRQIELTSGVLVLQAQEAVDSAISSYIAGALNALDLLSAEHVLFEAQRAVARAEADYAIALARLEGAVGSPIDSPDPQEVSP